METTDKAAVSDLTVAVSTALSAAASHHSVMHARGARFTFWFVLLGDVTLQVTLKEAPEESSFTVVLLDPDDGQEISHLWSRMFPSTEEIIDTLRIAMAIKVVD
jgi:hypothetical protein